MSFKSRIYKGKCKVKVDGEMTIYTAPVMKDRLISKIEKCEQMIIDLSQVSEMDSAGFQLLILAKQEADRRNKELCLKSVSNKVQEVLDLFHMTEELKKSTRVN